MNLHMNNFFHMSGMKRNDYFLIFFIVLMLWPSSLKQKKGRWVREGDTVKKKERNFDQAIITKTF